MYDRTLNGNITDMNEIKIIKLPVERWEEYKNLRLEALQQEPQAFSSSYEEEVQSSDQDWKDRLIKFSGDGNFLLLFAEVDGKLVGTMNTHIDGFIKMKHVAYIYGVYVSSDYRGKGVGKMLLAGILEWISTHSEVIKINLDVTTTQESAINLYKNFGFEKVGELKKELFVDCRFYDVYEMEKYLK